MDLQASWLACWPLDSLTEPSRTLPIVNLGADSNAPMVEPCQMGKSSLEEISLVATPKPRLPRYDGVTITFHWVTALLVVALFSTAMLWSYTPRDWELRRLEPIHVALGMALVAAVLGRIAWRLLAGRHLPGVGSSKTQALAKFVHLVLYCLLVVQLALGVALQWSSGEEMSFFGLFSIHSPLPENRDLGDRLENVHNLVAWAMMVVVFGHAVAALVHQYVTRDGVLGRMIPPWAVKREGGLSA